MSLFRFRIVSHRELFKGRRDYEMGRYVNKWV